MCAPFLFIGQFMEILPNNKHVFIKESGFIGRKHSLSNRCLRIIMSQDYRSLHSNSSEHYTLKLFSHSW